MASRLDRLFVLLETGSSSVTRRAAARQLGEVQRLHPHELHNLLARITTYLRSPSWETRIAAGQAVEAVIKNVPQWDPLERSEGRSRGPHCFAQAGRLTFEQFDMAKVLANSSHLMGSEGSEYDVEDDCSGSDPKEKMARQRQLLNARLGLDVAAKIGVDTSDIVSADDLVPVTEVKTDDTSRHALADVVRAQAGALSSREMNRARRKARQAVAKQRSGDEVTEEPDRKRVRFDDEEGVPDGTGQWGDALDWPFETWCDQLCQDLFNSAWEVRHGAATALREVLRLHGEGAGRSADCSREEMERQHHAWLEDISLRILCVLGLDRFGDFVSDQVVAPVRETCAQALGSVLHLMTPESVRCVQAVLLQLLEQREWEARHGGLLGLKYLLAVREDLVAELLTRALPPILAGLADPVDDVGAVAAAALIPVAPRLLKEQPDCLAPTVAKLWDLLAAQDELAAACNSFMGLLAALLSLPTVPSLVRPPAELLPRLWPFLAHSASSVRRATLQTLRTLTASHTLCWTPPLLQEALRHVFQRALVEPQSDIQVLVEQAWEQLVMHSPLEELLLAACPLVSSWLCLAMQPARLAFDPAMLVHSHPRTSEKVYRKPRAFSSLDGDVIDTPDQKLYLGGSETTSLATREQNVTGARCMAGRMLGLLSHYLVQPAPGVVYTPEMENPIDCYVKVLLAHLGSRSALQRLVAALVVVEWARRHPEGPWPETLITQLQTCVEESVCYDEVAAAFARLLQDAQDFAATLRHHGLLDASYCPVISLEQLTALSGTVGQAALAGARGLKARVAEALEDRRRTLQIAAQQASHDQGQLAVATQAALAGALVALRALPSRLNPVVKPLMEAVKREDDEQLQRLAAEHIAHLVELCVGRVPCPNSKIIANLCAFLCADPEAIPRILPVDGNDSGAESASDSSRTTTPTGFTDNFSGILTLSNQQRSAERAAFRRSNSTGGRGPGRPPLTDLPLEELLSVEDTQAQKQLRVQRRGASLALTAVCRHFKASLPERLPQLWERIVGGLRSTVAEELVSALSVLEVAAPALSSELLSHALECAPRLCELLCHAYRAVRHMSARCLGVLASLAPGRVVAELAARALPMLGAVECEARRQGAVEAVACVVDALQLRVVPFVVLLVVPLLGRMSDPCAPVRLLATHTFATLVQLMPLDGATSEPPDLPPELLQHRESERQFLEQLFNPRSISDCVVSVPVKATLRSYQQAGLNWLAFLNKYKLHGILCDDMGLGKTLQSMMMLACDHHARTQQSLTLLPSLVVCPPTLTGHWVYEVQKFLSSEHLSPLQYAGPPAEREKLRQQVPQHNLVVASYDIVRKDIDFFSSLHWNYVVLDEGHVIKNGKTKSAKAVKQLVANHRLILSGTPIQNNVLELWSLFDFLMPGFLGTERQFTARYSRPILASRDARSSAREQEAGALAMEALHRQVLPFMLRRTKEDVLQDLPPKITQDYYCELSPLQERLYEDFSRSQAHQSLQESLTQGTSTTHVFQALRYLQNVCNHPKLVLTPQHPEYERSLAQLAQQGTSLSDIHHAAKLPALMQLLLDCGIGAPSGADPVVNQHRALIFCQLKAMLDILEQDLLRARLPFVTYLRLDGSVPPGMRHSVVTRFNTDPSIDVLLLTTQVGGQGLNLTGADTVIFVEHDWNPMKDLQAMDRAHRIGQRKVVNVYRLITRGTLEEKIMGLQKFKLMTANTVISSENASMETMGTDQLLDLFSLEDDQRENRPEPQGGVSVKTVLETLPDLWDDKQYEEEYDLSTFVNSLHK